MNWKMYVQPLNAKKIMIYALTFIQTVCSNIYCDPENYEYYDPRIDRCVKCPKCPEGKEPISIEDFNSKVEFLEGPVECRRCTDCKFGTYSNVPSYECKPCTNCSSIGKTEIAKCTRNIDAICEKRSTVDYTTMDNVTEKLNEKDNMSVRNSTGNNLVIILTTFGCTVLIVAVAAAWYCLRKGRKQRNKQSITLEDLMDLEKKEYIVMHQRDPDYPERL